MSQLLRQLLQSEKIIFLTAFDIDKANHYLLFLSYQIFEGEEINLFLL